MPSLTTTLLLLLGVLLNAAAQLLLKQGMTTVGYFAFSWENILPIAVKTLSNPYVFLGLVAYVVSVVAWLLVLSRVNVSYAYPMLSIGYIVVAIAGHYLFHESLSVTRIIGILVIITGVYLLNRG